MINSIDKNNIPKHIAIIMDGNGRWAQKRGAIRVFGHNNAIKSVREVTEASAELGVEFLTLFAFSTENWNRPKMEIDALMKMLGKTLKSELETLQKNNVRLTTIGQLERMPQSNQKALKEAIEATKGNTGLTLVLALSYSGQWDILQACKKIALDVQNAQINIDQIDNDLISASLSTAAMPDPDLLIRTSGEVRISNFLLWQIAYTEIYITEVLWPNFRKEHLFEAIIDYQNRERRFGKTSEQL